MKTRVNKQLWVRLPFIVGARRLAWVQRRYNIPLRPLAMPKLEGGRNKQWQKALDLVYRRDMRDLSDHFVDLVLPKILVGHESS